MREVDERMECAVEGLRKKVCRVVEDDPEDGNPAYAIERRKMPLTRPLPGNSGSACLAEGRARLDDLVRLLLLATQLGVARSGGTQGEQPQRARLRRGVALIPVTVISPPERRAHRGDHFA